MESIDALARAIKEFEGGVVIVSHDFRASVLSFCYRAADVIFSRPVGLISQVAEELWEVADKTIKNLTKQDISIVDYKKNLVRQSTSFFDSFRSLRFDADFARVLGQAAIEKAKLFSKTAAKGKT
jgi:ATP-binding cassette, subfamily F, member 2